MLSLLVFAGFSVVVSLSVFLITNRIYRIRITTEIEDTTEFIAQSIDNFFEIPENYLYAVRKHINQAHTTARQQDPFCIITDLIEFMNAFESLYLIAPDGSTLDTWPYNADYIGIDMSKHDYFINEPIPNKIYWSDTFLSNRTGLPTVALTLRCVPGEVVAYYNLSQLENFISIDLEDKSEFIAVFDARGNIVVHTDPEHSLLTENLRNMQCVRTAISGNPGTTSDTYNGTKGIASITATKNSDFYVMVFKSNRVIFQRFYSINFVFFGIMVLVAACYILFILLILKNFLKPLDKLQETFQLVASGSYHSVPSSNITEFMVLTESFNSMVEQIHMREKALKVSIEDRETLLRELNHRTKNNMQLITSIIRLYTMQHPEMDPTGIMKRIQSKIETISLVHEKLYSSTDLSRINFREYLEELIPPLLESLSDSSNPVLYEIKVEDVFLLFDYAVPCGLILNELIINTLKYAFEPGAVGKVTIHGRMLGDNVLEISYSDNGKGLPAGFDIENTATLGLSIIHSIINSQLYGEHEINPENGFSCTFRFSLDRYKKRI